MQIELPSELIDQLQERVNASDEFDSVDAYIAFVLQAVISQTTETPAAPSKNDSVKQRLQDLGYLD